MGTPNTTENDTVYFETPGVAMIAKTDFNPLGIQAFLKQFDDHAAPTDPKFFPYTMDTQLEPGTYLPKFAGQLCYLSFGENRTKNADAGRYFENIRGQKHGSVLEHTNYSFLFWGVSRSFTHELVRHRAGWGYSQVSQRYVDGSRLRFVKRPEFTSDVLEGLFEDRIDDAANAYDQVAKELGVVMAGELEAMSKTDRRKATNQAARAVLPNETEAPIVATGNARAWRHFLNMRGSLFAEPEIRRVAIRTFVCLAIASPVLFEDFAICREDKTDRIYLHTEHPKV